MRGGLCALIGNLVEGREGRSVMGGYDFVAVVFPVLLCFVRISSFNLSLCPFSASFAGGKHA